VLLDGFCPTCGVYLAADGTEGPSAAVLEAALRIAVQDLGPEGVSQAGVDAIVQGFVAEAREALAVGGAVAPNKGTDELTFEEHIALIVAGAGEDGGDGAAHS
jgi:hypothetical protein